MKKWLSFGLLLMMVVGMFGATIQPASAWWHHGRYYHHRHWHHNWVWYHGHHVDRGWWVYW
jgi:hypothetical protein